MCPLRMTSSSNNAGTFLFQYIILLRLITANDAIYTFFLRSRRMIAMKVCETA